MESRDGRAEDEKRLGGKTERGRGIPVILIGLMFQLLVLPARTCSPSSQHGLRSARSVAGPLHLAARS